MKLKYFLCLSLFATTPAALAHQIWMEQDAGKTKLYFGEYGENLKETVPGLLKKMPVPKVSLIGTKGKQDVKATKGKDGFDVDAKAAGDEVLVAQIEDYPIWENKEEGKAVRTKWIPAARLMSHFKPTEATNFLDITAVGKENTFKLVFKGNSLAATKVALISPNGWMKEIWTDDNGEFVVTPLWKGTYVIEAQHKENIPGESNGEKFEVTSYTSTTTFVKPSGPETIRPKPAKPNPES